MEGSEKPGRGQAPARPPRPPEDDTHRDGVRDGVRADEPRGDGIRDGVRADDPGGDGLRADDPRGDSPGDGPRGAGPRQDDLLRDLQARLDAADDAGDRVRGLLDAVLSVGRELDLGQVLRRVVGAAAVLVDADRATLSVLAPDGRQLSHVLTAGAGPPSGRGMPYDPLRDGAEARRGEPAPLPPSRYEPAGRPYPARGPRPAAYPPPYPRVSRGAAADAFLAVPIRLGEQALGHLYLTGRRGGGAFDAEDEAVLSTLAVAAGEAIANARRYEQSRLRERWLRAGAEITRVLMSGAARQDVLALIAEHARAITGSALAVLSTPVADTGALTVEVAVGERAEAHRGLVVPVEGTVMGQAFTDGAPVGSRDLADDRRTSAGPPRFLGLGPGVAVPLGAGERVRAVVLLAREAGGPNFRREEVEPLEGFAAQAAVAMDLAERRRDAERIAVLEDRDRIARDLHDQAIQRLFATGMTLQSAGRLIDHPRAEERVLRAVDDLDETIRIIRSTIFGLRRRDDEPAPGLRARAVRVVDRATAALGFAPAVRMAGALDTRVPREIADQVTAVLSEALTNIARHARADRAEAVLETDGATLRLTVVDNGVGVRPGGRRGGLANMAERARALGGDLECGAPAGGGTRLVWHVPLPG